MKNSRVRLLLIKIFYECSMPGAMTDSLGCPSFPFAAVVFALKLLGCFFTPVHLAMCGKYPHIAFKASFYADIIPMWVK